MIYRIATLLRSEWRTFAGFLVAGGISVPVNIAARIFLSSLMRFEYAVVASHIIGMIVAFSLNKWFVFASSGRRLHSELVRFSIINCLSLAQTWLVSVGLVRLVFPALGFDFHPELIGHVIGLGLSSITSFAGHRLYSFAEA
jgi:putative flippase GtrA